MVAEVPVAGDLRALGREAEARKLPILLAFMASYCEYCEKVEQDFLVPMLISGDYDDKVIIRKVVIDSGGPLRGFDGKRIDPETLADRYGIRMTPTLLFLDGKGRELVERMEGLTTPDFYGGYLDAAIEQAGRAASGLGKTHRVVLLLSSPGTAEPAASVSGIGGYNSTF